MRHYMKLTVIPAVLLGLAACGQSGATTAAGTSVVANPESGSAEVGATVQGGSDWPQFRGLKGTGISPETGINKNWTTKPPKLLWTASLSDQGYAGPSCADGMVFIVDHDGSQDVVRAISLATGKDKWTYRYESPAGNNYGFTRATPAYSEGKLYTVSQLGLVNCIDAKTGKPIWNRNVQADFGGQKPGWDYAGSPLVDGNKVIVTPGGQNAGMVALDKNTGKTIWQGGSNAVPSYSTPNAATINGTKQYVVTYAKGIMGVDASNGKLLWYAKWETSYDVNAADPIVIGNSVFITSGYGHGCGLFDINGSSATKRWENKAIQGQFASSVFSGGYIYGTGDPGLLTCLNPKDGSVVWSQKGFEKSGAIGVDGVIITLDGGGNVVMCEMSPAGYKELGRLKAPLGGQSWTAPIIAQGKLIIRNKNSIACIDIR